MARPPSQKRNPLKAKGPISSVLTRCATKAKPQKRAVVKSSILYFRGIPPSGIRTKHYKDKGLSRIIPFLCKKNICHDEL